jgi:hypothetical protein
MSFFYRNSSFTDLPDIRTMNSWSRVHNIGIEYKIFFQFPCFYFYAYRRDQIFMEYARSIVPTISRVC